MFIVRHILNKSDNLMKEAYESDNIKGYGKPFYQEPLTDLLIIHLLWVQFALLKVFIQVLKNRVLKVRLFFFIKTTRKKQGIL